jgi:hypothetical protein
MSIKNVVIGIAIIILTIFVIVYGIGLFYERPEYYDFCPDVSQINTKTECINAGGVWYEGESEIGSSGYCEAGEDCYEEYDEAQEKYSKNIFLITLPLGIILIVAGIVIFGLETVGAGLAGGGIGVLLWGVGGYWRYGSNLMKFLLSLVGLVAVIWLAYWFNKKKK